MRLWSIHPTYLDSAGLTACWREGLLAKHVLKGITKGYRQHPQLIRFRESADPLQTMDEYLYYIWIESQKRNFHYDVSKISVNIQNVKLSVNDQQMSYEFEHLKRKLQKRNPFLYAELLSVRKIFPHPIFRVIKGGIEDWEKI